MSDIKRLFFVYLTAHFNLHKLHGVRERIIMDDEVVRLWKEAGITITHLEGLKRNTKRDLTRLAGLRADNSTRNLTTRSRTANH
jgi:hypothetical protein